MNKSGVGRRIKEERRRQKLNLKDLATMAGISFSYLSDIENERNNPSLSKFLDIATALGKTPSYFFEQESVKEEVSDFTSSDPEMKLTEKLLEEPGFREIIREFAYFDMWSEQEKAEILSFMKVKNAHKRYEKEMNDLLGSDLSE